MLCLTRTIRTDGTDADRRIFINDNIIITLCSIDRNKVVFGITAPSGVTIMREEVLRPQEVEAIERAAHAK